MAFSAVMLASQTAFAVGEDSFQKALDRGWLWLHLAAIGWGFLTSLTPCVYPMIPIVVGIFGGRDAGSRRRAFVLASTYVLGMALLFSTLGVAFALAGRQSNELLGNPWVVIPMVTIYVALAASMFGAFDLGLPQSWQQRLNQVGGRGYRGAFAMGLVGGLTAAPCTGPALLALLGFIGTTGNVVAGMSVMMAYAFGLGILFWVIAVFAVALPKSGRWMEWVKSFGGVALLVVAIYFLRPIWPWLRDVAAPTLNFRLAMLAVAVIGLVLGAIHLSFHGRTGERIRKALGVTLTVVGVSGLVGSWITPSRELEWRYDEAAAFAEAAETDKLVMIDFGAEWCVPCKEVEKVFAEEEVFTEITDNFIPLKFDVTEFNEHNKALKERYGAGAFPTVIFMTAEGQELGRFTSKDISADSFLATLNAAIAAKPGSDS